MALFKGSIFFVTSLLLVGTLFASPVIEASENVASVMFIGNIFSEAGNLIDRVSLQFTGRTIFFADLPACTDSDGGMNPSVRGTGTGYYSGGIASQNFVFGENPNSATSGSYRIDPSLNGSSIYHDHCFNSETHNQLNEGFCDSNGKLSAFGYPCQYGCRDGVCLACGGTTCNPSDYTQICNNGQWTSCPSGQMCSSGACIAAQCSGTECNSNNTAQICSQGQWNNCQLGYSCRNDACVPGCTGTTCNPTNGNQYCNNGEWANCPSGQVCSSGGCIGAPVNNTNNSSNNSSQSSQNIPSSQPVVQLPVFQPSIQSPVQLTCVQNTCNRGNNQVVCSSGQWVACPGNATCSNGVCVLLNQTATGVAPVVENGIQGELPQRVSPERDTLVISGNESFPQQREFECSGCIIDGRCVPLGYRVIGNYCLLNGSLALQKVDSELCENHFECNSNLCVSGKCVSSNLIIQILEWLKRLLGLQ